MADCLIYMDEESNLGINRDRHKTVYPYSCHL